MTRIEKLLSYMEKCGVDGAIIPTSDPHLSEYIPEHYKLRQWLSGFTGSAGTLAVTKKECGLWTDGRYYLQAEKELSGSGITLYRASEKDCMKIHEFFAKNLKKDDVVGVDGKLFSKRHLDSVIKNLGKENLRTITDFAPETVWEDRPCETKMKAFLLDEKFCGESAKEKIERVRKHIKEKDFTHYLTSAPDSVMWLLNIRGNDVLHTPVMLSYLLMDEKDVFLYADAEKIDEEMQKYLLGIGVTLKDYEKVYADLSVLDENDCVKADFSLSNYKLINSVNCAIRDRSDIVADMKGIKNEKETENIKKAYIKENVALTKAFYEIYHSEGIDECDVSEIIEKYRKQQQGYFSPSFDTIAAFGKNAAMVHYCAKKDDCAKIGENGLLLIDTGGQYPEGTTDTTRTLAIGKIPEEEKENLTRVLKGNIDLLLSVFPSSAAGRDLDAIARRPLWKKGLDYKHSTGHGIGYFLCVHEGPQRISSASEVRLVPGMTISDEPGVYIEGKYGIRIENHLAVKEFENGEDEKFLCFEVLNFCPIGTGQLKAQLLDSEEKEWLNSYNDKCRQLLSDYLSEEENEWLKEYTMKI